MAALAEKPKDILELKTATQGVLAGEVTREETYRPRDDELAALPREARLKAEGKLRDTHGDYAVAARQVAALCAAHPGPAPRPFVHGRNLVRNEDSTNTQFGIDS